VKYIPVGAYAAQGGAAGHNDYYVVGPNYVELLRSYMLMDNPQQVMCVVRTLPTPQRASQFLAKHGRPSLRAV